MDSGFSLNQTRREGEKDIMAIISFLHHLYSKKTEGCKKNFTVRSYISFTVFSFVCSSVFLGRLIWGFNLTRGLIELIVFAALIVFVSFSIKESETESVSGNQTIMRHVAKYSGYIAFLLVIITDVRRLILHFF
jgi:hypothetical protein